MPIRSLLFLHANGYPPGCYRQLLELLQPEYDVLSPEFVPSAARTPGVPLGSWSELAGGVVAQLEERSSQKAWVGVGHSMGAIVLLHVAAQRPARFSRLVLLDPPVLSRALLLALRWMPPSWRARGEMAKKAARRTGRWPDAESAFRDLRQRRALTRVPDSVIWDYVNHGTQLDGEQRVLRFSKAWEIELHSCPPDTWAALGTALPPITVVRGALSHLLAEQQIAEWQRRRPQDRHVTLEQVGHLCPLEDPSATARAVLTACAAG